MSSIESVRPEYIYPPSTVHVDEVPPYAREDEVMIGYYNVLRPQEDLVEGEKESVGRFEDWIASKFLNDAFLTEKCFFDLGEDQIHQMIEGLLQRVFAQGMVFYGQAADAQERALADLREFVSCFENGERAAREYQSKQDTARSFYKRAGFLAEKLEEYRKDPLLALGSLYNSDTDMQAYEELAHRSLDRMIFPYNTWEYRRGVQEKGIRRFVERAQEAPWALAFQEVTPTILDHYKSDLKDLNIQWISYNIGTGEETKPFSEEKNEFQFNRSLTCTIALAEKLKIRAPAKLGRLPEAVKGMGKAPRLILAVEVEDLKGRVFTIITTHTDFRVSKAVYEETAAAIAEFSKGLNGTLIFGGDLNMFNGVPGVNEYYDNLKKVFPEDFRDKTVYAPKEFEDISFIGYPGEKFNPKYDPSVGKYEGNALDQILLANTTEELSLHYGVRDPMVFDKDGNLHSLEEANRAAYVKDFQEGRTASDHGFQYVVLGPKPTES